MRPFDHVRRELDQLAGTVDGGPVRGDPERHLRTGGPEVIYAAAKSVDQILAGIDSLLSANGRVVVSHISPQAADELLERLPADLNLVMAPGNRSCLVTSVSSERRTTGGRVAVISAGTSDIPVAAEAALIAAETGCSVETSWDVGVAGIHRLVRPLEAMIDWDPDVFIVAAGMDGILPTIVSGLVPQPVIGLPISSGYGFGGEGLGALTTMLQTCSPGLSVVNIDNGIGAGMTAARIANRVAAFRTERS